MVLWARGSAIPSAQHHSTPHHTIIRSHHTHTLIHSHSLSHTPSRPRTSRHGPVGTRWQAQQREKKRGSKRTERVGCVKEDWFSLPSPKFTTKHALATPTTKHCTKTQKHRTQPYPHSPSLSFSVVDCDVGVGKEKEKEEKEYSVRCFCSQTSPKKKLGVFLRTSAIEQYKIR